jgi:hypothetical protein
MTLVGQIEKRTQTRVVALFRNRLNYDYLGDKTDLDFMLQDAEHLGERFLNEVIDEIGDWVGVAESVVGCHGGICRPQSPAVN